MDRIQRIARRSTGYVVGTFLRRGLSFLLIPLYTMFMPPSAFAIFALADVVISLGRILFTLGLETAFFRFFFVHASEEDRRRFYGSVWTFQLLFSGLLAIIMSRMGASHFPEVLAGIPFDPYVKLAIWIAFLRAGFELIAMEIFRARGKADAYARYSLAAFLLGLALQIYFVARLREGVLGALRGMLIAACCMAILYSRVILRECRMALSWMRIRQALAYSLPLVPHLVAHWILSLSDRWILGRFVPLADLGVYSLADQLRQGYGVIQWSANSAIMPVFGKAAVDEGERRAIPQLSTYYLFGITAIGLGIVLLGPVVLPLIAPPGYQVASRLLPLLILGGLLYGAYFLPMNVLSQTVGRTHGVSAVTLTAGLTNIALNLALVPRFGIWAAAVNTVIGYMLLLVLMHRRANRALWIGFEYQRAAIILGAATLTYLVSLAMPAAWPTPAQWIGRVGLLGLFPLLVLAAGFLRESELENLRSLLPWRAKT